MLARAMVIGVALTAHTTHAACGDAPIAVNGKTCVFPFTYEGTVYNTCASPDETTLYPGTWCATVVDATSNDMLQWDFCACDASCRTTDDGACAECEPLDSSKQQMCLDANSTATCKSGCDWVRVEPIEIVPLTTPCPRTTPIGDCVFPFTDDAGVSHDHCTTTGAQREWCATSKDTAGKYVNWNYCECTACATYAVLGDPCVFPFKTKTGGAEHNKCTTEPNANVIETNGVITPWCPLRVDSAGVAVPGSESACSDTCGFKDITNTQPDGLFRLNTYGPSDDLCPRTTVSGSPCVFPFIVPENVDINTADDTSYDRCTTAGDTKEWCATSLNGDGTYRTWDMCACEGCAREIIDRDTECVFPFTHATTGEVFTDCAPPSSSGTVGHTCALGVDADGKQRGVQGTCTNSCGEARAAASPTEVERALARSVGPIGEDCPRKTTLGKDCIFPFTFEGMKYDRCTMNTTRDIHKEWCASGVDASGLMTEWYYCECEGCASETKTIYQPCKATFSYAGKDYTKCTTDTHPDFSVTGTSWCAVDVDSADVATRVQECSDTCGYLEPGSAARVGAAWSVFGLLAVVVLALQ